MTTSADVAESGRVVLVCLSGSDASSLALALRMAKPAGERAIFVSMDGQETDALLHYAGAARGIHLVPTNIRAVSEAFLQQSGPELMARARHEAYLAKEREKGRNADDNCVAREVG